MVDDGANLLQCLMLNPISAQYICKNTKNIQKSDFIESNSPTGCIRIPLNLLWLIFGGLWACIMHLFFGFLLCITIIGIPWGKQHFKMAGLSLAPFGKDVELGF